MRKFLISTAVLAILAGAVSPAFAASDDKSSSDKSSVIQAQDGQSSDDKSGNVKTSEDSQSGDKSSSEVKSSDSNSDDKSSSDKSRDEQSGSDKSSSGEDKSGSGSEGGQGSGGGGGGSDSSGGKSQGGGPRVNAGGTTGYGTVTVFTPLTVNEDQGLSFGTITSGASGQVSIDANSGARQVAGGVGAVGRDAGHNAAFTVTGQANAAIHVYVAGSISGFGAGITGATAPSALPVALRGTTAGFSVGGTLAIPARTPAGVYTGTYQVAVNYP